MSSSTTTNLLDEYRKFRTLAPVFIGGVRRSGTTLLQRMLDGHPQLLVYSFEDCIVRDSFFESRLFRLHELHELLDSRDAKTVLEYMISNPKLALALESQVDASDEALGKRHLHLGGAQILHNQVDRKLFTHSFLEIFRALGDGEWDVANALRVWMFSFFNACGVGEMSNHVAWVTKCPDEGRCFPLYLRLFPNCRVIHLIRDPRGFYASESRRVAFGKPGFSARRIRQAAELWTTGVLNLHEADLLAPKNSMCIRYEDLIDDPEGAMKAVADFIQVGYSDCLLEPTFRGRPWNANTSFETDTSMRGRLLTDRGDRWKRTLALEEHTLLERMLFRDMVALGYMSRMRAWSWWVRTRIVPVIRRWAGHLAKPARSLLRHVGGSGE